MLKKRALILMIPVASLLVALVLQAGTVRDLKRGDTASDLKKIGMSDLIPLQIEGFSGRDEPLGPTEFLESAVEQNLNYDDMINRVYQKGDLTLGVYSAYWSPGRMPVQKVASHTPDRCWVENGWSCIDYRRDSNLSLDSGLALSPAQWREFHPPSSSESTYVMYWHLVGGELYDYGEGMNTSLGPIAWWKETLHYAFKGSADQYFVRLTSNQPFEVIWANPGVQEILAALAKLGLAASPLAVSY